MNEITSFKKNKISKVVLNTDMTGYDNIVNQRKQGRTTAALFGQIANLNQQVDDLRNDLRILLEKNNVKTTS